MNAGVVIAVAVVAAVAIGFIGLAGVEASKLTTTRERVVRLVAIAFGLGAGLLLAALFRALFVEAGWISSDVSVWVVAPFTALGGGLAVTVAMMEKVVIWIALQAQKLIAKFTGG